MKPSSAGPNASRQQPKTRQRRRANAKGALLDVGAIIDNAFRQHIKVVENGKSVRVCVFEAIFKMLWLKEVGGDTKALAVRIKYEAYARKQQPDYPKVCLVEGGLPNRRRDHELKDD